MAGGRPGQGARKGATRRARGARRPAIAGVFAVGIITVGVVVWLAQQQTAANNPAVGAPTGQAVGGRNLTMPSTQGGTLSLQRMAGHKVVLFFYEGSTCGACQQQLTQLQQDLPSFRATGAVTVAASVDPVATSRGLAAQLGLGFPIVQDRNHQLGAAFGDFDVPTAGMTMGPVDNHAIFVLDQHGVVRWKDMAADTMHVSDADVLAALRRI